MPQSFRIFLSDSLSQIVEQGHFEEYYKTLKPGKSKLEFVFTHLVNLFLAAGFNGAYIFVDDFERIPDFQSERQKKDFALELRTCLFDGLYTNSKVGFYNFILVLHAGVPRLIQSAWEQSGLDMRAPISFEGTAKNIIRFDKIKQQDALPLVQKYIQAYRIHEESIDKLYPFTEESITKIAELSDYNASKIIKMAYDVLENAVDSKVEVISLDFLLTNYDYNNLATL